MEKVIPIIDLIETPPLYRKDYGGIRHYLSLDEDGNIVNGAISVTSKINLALKESQGLSDWKFNFPTKTDYKKAMNTMAYYGTIMHVVMGQIAIGVPVMLDDNSIMKMFRLNQEQKEYGGLPEYANYSLPAEVNNTVYDCNKFRKDAIAMRVLFNDMFSKGDAEIVGIELPLANFELNMAGCLDLVIRRTKDDKVVYEIYDLKTGSGHYLSHDIQLTMYAILLSQYLGIDRKDVNTYNIHLKDYGYDTLEKYLNGNTKTRPYIIKKVECDDTGWRMVDITYDYLYKPVDYWAKEYNFTTTPEDVISQLTEKGEDEDEPKIDN